MIGGDWRPLAGWFFHILHAPFSRLVLDGLIISVFTYRGVRRGKARGVWSVFFYALSVAALFVAFGVRQLMRRFGFVAGLFDLFSAFLGALASVLLQTLSERYAKPSPAPTEPQQEGEESGPRRRQAGSDHNRRRQPAPPTVPAPGAEPPG